MVVIGQGAATDDDDGTQYDGRWRWYNNFSCQLPAAAATATTLSHDLMVCWCDILFAWLYDGVIVC